MLAMATVDVVGKNEYLLLGSFKVDPSGGLKTCTRTTLLHLLCTLAATSSCPPPTTPAIVLTGSPTGEVSQPLSNISDKLSRLILKSFAYEAQDQA